MKILSKKIPYYKMFYNYYKSGDHFYNANVIIRKHFFNKVAFEKSHLNIFYYIYIMKEYYCKYCIYTSKKSSHFKKHISTEKHRKKIIEYTNNDISNFREVDSIIVPKFPELSKYITITCMYCKKEISHKKNLTRHYSVCKEKKAYEVTQEKNKLMEKLKEKDKMIDNLLEEKDKLEDEYQSFIKEIAISNNKGPKVVNMVYMINNFTNAQDYDEIMEKPLTKQETKRMLKLGPVHGCIDLIKSRCITNIPVDLRSLHCSDASRIKFSYYKNGKWKIDYRADKIIDKMFHHMDKTYHHDFKGPIEKKSEYIKYLADIRLGGKSRKFIVDSLTEPLLLSNIDINQLNNINK